MIELKYFEILKLNKDIGESLTTTSYDITVFSNIIVNQINEILEYVLRVEGINANVESSDYDNIVQNSNKYRDSNSVIIFWELSNIIDGLHYKIELFNADRIDEIFEKLKSEINLVLKNLEKTSLVLINKFTSLPFCSSKIKRDYLDDLSNQLNNYLDEIIFPNVKLVNLDRIISSLGISNSIDWRYYYSSKSPYTIDFFKSYSNYIKPFYMSVNGKSKKALIFDCDNTLWKGILGEDGINNIEMSESTNAGSIFSEIQSIALSINNQGILIGLCSKNNPDEIDEVIRSHPDMKLRKENITINKSNWSDKATNLKEIAQELNIGLDSIVFIDDSSFEVNLIREKLPEVTVLQVPEKLYNYPKMFRENMSLFYNSSLTSEDSKKIKMYKDQSKRESSKQEFTNIEDYLASLDLKINMYINDESIIPRISQMSQKTNQFNLTTKRYTEGDIQNFIKDPNSDVYAFSVSDKFGDSGIVGLCIVNSNVPTIESEIDTFLMSCRVIGRNIEFVFMDYIIRNIKEKKIIDCKAKYIKTDKNEQVIEFFDSCSFTLINENESVRNYHLDINKYLSKKIKYIEVIDGK